MSQHIIQKLLIANRGEIACRIIRTARKMGIATVAVYSEIDASALHVKLADEAVCIGSAAAKDSYLRVQEIIRVAKMTGADAIHPGYGFLSENAEFAQACADNQIIFVGPPISAIEAMGSKSEAKRIMADSGVPLVPGYHGDNQDEDFLQQQADSIGYPVLIKAAAGGGGKGMRLVETSAEFIDSLRSCKREAASSFGDDEVLLEKYLRKPRHVELQIFADAQGNTVHLFERDCSVQRRHQKIIEEAPAPNISDDTRTKMAEAAIAAAKAINYQGAGTVEFLLDEDESFYFMEMNTRLQVEHPVTEMITGIDLVEWQIVVASGLPLPCSQAQIKQSGHAFEARIYAEDPLNDFLPASGKITYLSEPTSNKHVRVDSGVVSQDEVSVYYDPMIAKLIVWNKTRDAALARLKGALADYQVAGIKTNIEFLHNLAAHDAFMQLDLDTHFLDRYGAELIETSTELPDDILCAAVVFFLNRQSSDVNYGNATDPFSPWLLNDGWRLNQDNYHVFKFDWNGQTVTSVVHFREGGYLIEHKGNELFVSATIEGNNCSIDLNGHKQRFKVIQQGKDIVVFKNHQNWCLSYQDPAALTVEDTASGSLTAPMPGTIVSIAVEPGDQVSKGETLIVMEAMKMEHSITAPHDGVVEEIFYNAGDQVSEGSELIRVRGEDEA